MPEVFFALSEITSPPYSSKCLLALLEFGVFILTEKDTSVRVLPARMRIGNLEIELAYLLCRRNSILQCLLWESHIYRSSGFRGSSKDMVAWYEASKLYLTHLEIEFSFLTSSASVFQYVRLTWFDVIRRILPTSKQSGATLSDFSLFASK